MAIKLSAQNHYFFLSLNSKISLLIKLSQVSYSLKIMLHQFLGIIENFSVSNFWNNRKFQIIRYSELIHQIFETFRKLASLIKTATNLKIFEIKQDE